jgi:signal transduction histidine kinase
MNSKDAIEKLSIQNRNFEGLIKIELKISQENINIIIEDNGGGISNEILDKVFLPYFTTKFASQGTGAGLYMSKTIIEKLHGGILLASSHDKNTKFEIILLAYKELLNENI